MATDDAIVLGAVAACALIVFGAWLVRIEAKLRAFEHLVRTVSNPPPPIDRRKTPIVRRSALHRLIDLTRRKT